MAKPTPSDSKALWADASRPTPRSGCAIHRIGFVRLAAYRHDIAGASRTRRCWPHPVLKQSELTVIVPAGGNRAQIDRGQFKWRTDLEDVHMNIEAN